MWSKAGTGSRGDKYDKEAVKCRNALNVRGNCNLWARFGRVHLADLETRIYASNAGIGRREWRCDMKLQLGEHIKRIGGREYVWQKISGDKDGKYKRPITPKQPKTMEHLSARDAGIIQRAYKKGVAVSTIQDHVWHAVGVRVSAQTIYAYMKRHGVERIKRDVRIDKGKETISISGSARISIIEGWNRGEGWQKIQGKIRQATGDKVGRSTIYGYMRTHGNAAKRRAALQRQRV